MICSPPVQRKLVLDDQPRCILADVSTARAELRGFDERDIWMLIEDGFLLAWNIALLTGINPVIQQSINPVPYRRELRILPETIEFYKRTGGSRGKHNFSATWPMLLTKGFTKPFVFSPQIALLLNCKCEHITHLIDAGHLQQMPGTSYRRGPTGAACVAKASLLNFLKARLE